jgi:ATP-dependent Clp protease protease subunit
VKTLPKILRPVNKKPGLKFWNFVNSSDEEADLYVYGDIVNGDGWIYEYFGLEATDQVEFIKNLNSLGLKKVINVYINSMGGDVYAAQTILDVLKRNPAYINTYIDGIAASAAGVIAMAGDKLIMPLNAQLMIHDPLVDLYGYFNSADLESMKDMLDQVKAGIIAAYMMKSNLSEKEISKLMSKETHLTAKQALELGFADEILYDKDKQVDVVNAGRFIIVNSLAFEASKLQSSNLIIKNEGVDFMPNIITQTQQPVVQTIPVPQPGTAPVNQPVNQPVAVNPQPVINQSPVVNQQSTTPAAPPMDAITQERQRLQAIDAIAAGIDPALVNEAKYGANPMTAEQLAFKAMTEGKLVNRQVLDAAIAANKVSGVEGVKPVAVEQTNDPQLDLGTVAGVNKALGIIAAASQSSRPISRARH